MLAEHRLLDLARAEVIVEVQAALADPHDLGSLRQFDQGRRRQVRRILGPEESHRRTIGGDHSRAEIDQRGIRGVVEERNFKWSMSSSGKIMGSASVVRVFVSALLAPSSHTFVIDLR